jgi:3-isopropylmalate/(R)-2-methylmalate dehydratase small subunit
MKPFTNFESRVLPLAINNIDTDQIIPARFLKTTSKTGLDQQLFHDWRYDAQGHPRPDFILNQPRAQGVQVLLTGDNFGCGSSREHAPWALTQWGLRAVISTSFADIFKQNSLKNSLLPIVVPADVHGELFAAVEANPGATVTVDLRNQTLTTPTGREVKFPIDEFSKHCLLEGIDELGYILQHAGDISTYEGTHAAPIDCLTA